LSQDIPYWLTTGLGLVLLAAGIGSKARREKKTTLNIEVVINTKNR
jgi:hypothetical protein